MGNHGKDWVVPQNEIKAPKRVEKDLGIWVDLDERQQALYTSGMRLTERAHAEALRLASQEANELPA